MRADQAVGDQRGAGQHHRRHREQHHERAVTSIAQTNSGMRFSVMPGARSLKMVVIMTTASSSADSSVKVIICAQKSMRLPGEYSGPGQRHVGEPAGVRPGVQEEGDVQHQAAEQEDPVGEGVHAREGHAARADHQRHQVDGHGLHHRHGEQEHHRRAVHREELVVQVRARSACFRPRQLQAHQQRQQAAGAKKPNVVSMKRLAMVLWLMAQNQPKRPGGSLQVRSSAARARRRRRPVAARAGSGIEAGGLAHFRVPR
jgi:hypothetical protein